VQRHAEQTGGEVGGAIIRQLFDEAYVAVPEGWRLGNFDIHRDGGRVRMEATVGGQDVAGEGKGAVEALIDALRRVHGVNGSVEAFDEYALGSGTAASAMACIKLRIGTEISVGVALAEDTSTATLQAVLSAFGRQKAGVSIAA
jgi:2-isopropylmalate synthase